MTNNKTLKDLAKRASKQDPNSILVLAGYEFQQGVAWADIQWLNRFIHYLADCELEAEDIVEITGLDMDRVIDIIIKEDPKMGAPVW